MRVPARLSLRNSELPASFWYLWLGTVINRLGGFAVPFLMSLPARRRVRGAVQPSSR
jgi:hypothetical protein